MKFPEIIEMLLKAVLIPLLPLLTLYVTRWVAMKSESLKGVIADQELEQFVYYVELVENLVNKIVVFVNQTYVDTLKKEGAFTKESQTEAFNTTKLKIMEMVTEDGIIAIEYLYGDYLEFIDTTIEQMVKYNKEVPLINAEAISPPLNE